MRLQPSAPVRKLRLLTTGAAVLGIAVFAAAALAQSPMAASSAAKPVAAKASAAAGRAAPAAKAETKPLWNELTPAQRQALAPLAAAWPQISEAQKRKWLVISKSHAGLPPAEQAKMHSRMTEWVGLSAQQRTQARLNFAETKQLASDDKKAKWEAYKALPPEEKRKLAAGAASAPKPPSTAAAVKPVPPQKLATMPKTADSKTPRIAAAPSQAEHTSPPQPAPAAPAPGN
jgi:hypothetical protein